MIKLFMRVLTVRSVATFLRAPWCNSMAMVFLDGWEKQTERWDISLTSLPAMRKTRYVFSTILALWHTSRTLHTDYPGLNVYLDYSNVSIIPQWFNCMRRYARFQGFGEGWLNSSSAQTKYFRGRLTIGRYGQRLFRVYVPHLGFWVRGVKEWLS